MFFFFAYLYIYISIYIYRERIPERNVHARGALAKGYFQLTNDVSKYTFADLFNGVGKKTPLALRFSSVIHGIHSPEFLRK